MSLVTQLNDYINAAFSGLWVTTVERRFGIGRKDHFQLSPGRNSRLVRYPVARYQRLVKFTDGDAPCDALHSPHCWA